jgi:tyrosine-protein phosphatase SIW14
LVSSAITFSSYRRGVAILALALLAGNLAPPNCPAQEVSRSSSDPRSVLTFGEKLKLRGVPNAGKVGDMLYRGAQPRDLGYQQLKNLGVNIVVDLRNTKSNSAEQSSVEAFGMHYISIATSAFFGPTDSEVAAFLKVIRDNPQQKIFVHCYFGDDRTGVMIATYRMAEQHWTADQAYNEMRSFHFHTYLVLMGHYVKAFPNNFAASPAFTAIREPARKASPPDSR